ncbi:hypothetical protein MKEN_00210200 [Mycena kentingensis (nom. inval.)]|nr:hypothetical protein MKEN_00210200 [Mycena kentingensis (nom. inval.)]
MAADCEMVSQTCRLPSLRSVARSCSGSSSSIATTSSSGMSRSCMVVVRIKGRPRSMTPTTMKKLLRSLRLLPTPPAPTARKPVEVIVRDPRLPSELESLIFELVAYQELPWMNATATILALPLVCRRVQAWIEPLFYHRISLVRNYEASETELPKFLYPVAARSPSFFATHVPSLYFDYTIPLVAVQRILGVCTNVVQLGCHHPYSSLALLLDHIPLQHLMLSEFAFPPNPPPWTRSLTHLGLTDHIPSDPQILLDALPSLTALAVGVSAFPDPSESPEVGRVVKTLLSLLPARVQTLVLTIDAKTTFRWTMQRFREESVWDERLYVHLRPVMDATWDGWSKSKPDMFEDAERERQLIRGTRQAAA